MNRDVTQLLTEHFSHSVRSIQLSEWTTLRIGGPAVSVVVSSIGMLSDLLGVMKRESVPWFVLGRGSNVLASDRGCREIIIILKGELADVQWELIENRWSLNCGCGKRLPSLSGAACCRGAAGLTFAVGIPGTVGGAVFMNAGAYGNAISDLLSEVRVIDPNGDEKVLNNADCGFSYRSSRFQNELSIITGVELMLEKGDPDMLRSEAHRVLQLRREKFPLEYPNAGSVFRRPDGGVPPGKLIEDAGLKGRTVGGAMISFRHANFIVNTGGASSSDVMALVETIREGVHAMSGIVLDEEIRYLGRRN